MKLTVLCSALAVALGLAWLLTRADSPTNVAAAVQARATQSPPVQPPDTDLVHPEAMDPQEQPSEVGVSTPLSGRTEAPETSADRDSGDFRAVVNGEELSYRLVRDVQEAALIGLQFRSYDSDRVVIVTSSSTPLLDGPHTAWHENGEKAAEGWIRNGDRVGEWTEWHANGKRATQGGYFYGAKQGLWTEWYGDGERSSSGYYLYGDREGPWSEWHENGQKKRSMIYRNGGYQGVVAVWHANGNRESEAAYAGGTLEGRWISYHPNGQMESRGDYHYGQRVGKWSFWDREGVLDTAKTGLYREGEKDE